MVLLLASRAGGLKASPTRYRLLPCFAKHDKCARPASQASFTMPAVRQSDRGLRVLGKSATTEASAAEVGERRQRELGRDLASGRHAQPGEGAASVARRGRRRAARLRRELMERERPREGPLRTFTTLGCLWSMLATDTWPLRVTPLRLWSPSRDCRAKRHSQRGQPVSLRPAEPGGRAGGALLPSPAP